MKSTTYRRKLRNRSKVRGQQKPRLSVFRSNKNIYAQVIDDIAGKTLVSANDLKIDDKKLTKTDKAKEVGKMVAEMAVKAKITDVVFDRGEYKYHGRVKALAESAREHGLKF